MNKHHDNYFMRPSTKLPVILLFSLLAVYSCNCLGEITVETTSVTSSKDESLQTVPFITLRNRTGSEKVSEYFGGERNAMHAGYCDLGSTSLSTLKPVADKVPFYIPEDILTLVNIRESDIDEFWNNMKTSSNGNTLALYTHGFNIDFEKGCRRASLFQRSVELKSRFLFFSWPSDGAIMNYTHDEADIYWSVEPLRQTLNEMLARFAAGNINLAAHSLGARGVFLALVMIAQTEQSNKPLFNQLVFIAPDIDAATFQQYLPLIRPLARNMTIYTSANDNALALSRQVHGYPRLGETGTHLDSLTGVEIIDLSYIAMRSPSGHLYHLYHNDVVNDLNQILNDAKPAALRRNLRQTGKNYWQLEPSTINR